MTSIAKPVVKIFPRRLTRRDFLKTSAMATAALSAPQLLRAKETKAPVRIGSGEHTYELVENWGALPNGAPYGLGCGIVVDSKDRIYVLTRTQPGLAIFDRKGKLLEIWQEEPSLKKGISADTWTKSAHGLFWNKEGGKEFLYFTENKPGARVTKTDLKGNVLLRIGNVTEESATSVPFTFVSPTDVTIGTNGDIYVVDGYGSQLVHRFAKDGKLIRTIGGPGKEHGKFNTCHGIWINTLKGAPEIYIADRANGRLEVYSMDLDYKRTIGEVRNPCCFYQHKKLLFVPDIDHRVTIFDAEDKVAAHLGDGKGDKEAEKNPAMFVRPHALTVDSHGDLYVMEWLPTGRVRKFKHTPQPA
jgi:peptidylamidoglycolate lyase